MARRVEGTLAQAAAVLDVSELIRAGGGIVIRTTPEGKPEIALVHRPRYDDWTFPKGKLQGGETDEQTAIREVEEETGLRCTLGRDLGTISYRDSLDRPKIVRYWVMSVESEGLFTPNEEVDEFRWYGPEQADATLTYDHDREVLHRYTRGGSNAPVFLVRHGKSGARSDWTEADELRPLSKAGRRQAEAIVATFRDREVDRIVSSPYVRCVQTVRPLALDRRLPVETSDALAEGAATQDAVALLAEVDSGPAVLCSHGDVIPALVLHFMERGMLVTGERDWRKGSIWLLEREDGRFVRGHYLAPPEPSG